MASVPLDGIEILQGQQQLRVYEFNTRTAKHYFCGVCGIFTHHQRRSNPTQYGFNLGCLDGVNPSSWRSRCRRETGSITGRSGLSQLSPH